MACEEILYKQKFPVKGGDFIKAGNATLRIRKILKEIGVDPQLIQRITLASREGEINIVKYTPKGSITLSISPSNIHLVMKDKGDGIENLNQAMQPGYSTATPEMKEIGFGTGMGLTNMESNADVFEIKSSAEEGTIVQLSFKLDKNEE